ncbi:MULTISPECIES: hypothetical protein [unclassified Sphingomonas]|uniref:hypothetical protein n=1 Tax=unclassified Sphingomonas TaxID=196159 RepID=UPI0007000243|nr:MULTISPECIES: hypothetical protein [unclassified Sphingomonas]KQM60091.1 hypothetical protein ASE65_10320 [Sphingomonas sp. Leaf16]KQN11489.1 hypothetical protein ASE81_11305 [Sphingomonas sp. Leaf29]KQN18811.1 hypothetical protein ASE83_11245 [Sphingomonas sp. Leaf32]
MTDRRPSAIALDFPLRSDNTNRRPCDVPLEELRRMARVELDRRRSTYPMLVSRGRLAPPEADRRLDTWAAIVADLDRDAARRAHAAGRSAPGPSTVPYGSTWTARVLDLHRELATARDTFPAMVASPANPLTADTARTTLECLDALLHRYWVDLDGFSGPLHFRDDHVRAGWIAAAEQRTAPDPAWAAIGRLADRHAAGTVDQDASSRCTALARWTLERTQQLLEERAPHHRYVWTVQVDTWLLARSRPPA